MMREGGHGALAALYQKLSDDPRLAHGNVATFSEFGPVLSMQARVGEHVLSMFTMMAEFSTVQDVTMSERRVELFFAADEKTREFFAGM
jgi:hypothetical protein